MSEVIITVRGEHETRIAPEQGVVHLTLRVEGPERGGVVERIAALAAPLRDDLTARDAAGTVVEWSSQRVSIWSDRPWNAEGKQLSPVHHASVEYLVTFDDFTVLSWWVSELADKDGVQIAWIEWRLTPATRADVERDVAAEAVTVAVMRATAYAGAIGLTAVTPLEIADLGLLTRNEPAPGGPQPKMMRAAFAMADSTGGGPSVQLQPEDITVTAAVEARFVAH
ncbi:neuraminidase [Microbacterium sp. Root61]|uniref:SIMPL domain-containing protein n=1 Tax=Microbacterium sp. Root61 TaxID=1736570 RepID=UPI0006F9DF44|nr:SIMPL domain-containing protein [Microbacterium sp. Root61]KRA23703.1 neuraminidase [Microbacterium sp. Root61]